MFEEELNVFEKKSTIYSVLLFFFLFPIWERDANSPLRPCFRQVLVGTVFKRPESRQGTKVRSDAAPPRLKIYRSAVFPIPETGWCRCRGMAFNIQRSKKGVRCLGDRRAKSGSGKIVGHFCSAWDSWAPIRGASPGHKLFVRRGGICQTLFS